MAGPRGLAGKGSRSRGTVGVRGHKQALAAGTAGRLAPRGVGSSRRRQRTARSPPPSASPRVLAERAAVSPGLRFPGAARRSPAAHGSRGGRAVLPLRAGQGGAWAGAERVRRAQPEVWAEPEEAGPARERGRGWDTCGGGGGGGGARGFKKVRRGRALSQARPRGVACTPAAAALQADDALSAPAVSVPPALSLPRPKVTSGASVSRQVTPAGSVARNRSARARRRLAFPARGFSLPVPPKVDERARGARGGSERGGMERGCWAPRTLVLAVLLLLLATLRARAATGYYPRFSPFFFLCTHHGELEGDGEQGEVLISLHIAGNPTYYVPGQEYHGRYHGVPTAPRWPASASLHPFPSSQGPAGQRDRDNLLPQRGALPGAKEQS